MSAPLTALVLAGSRPGGDPLAGHEGVARKADIDIGGKTMIERVTEALLQSRAIDRVAVVIDDAASLPNDVLIRLPVAETPSRSVRAAAETLGTPLLVTTADHALLLPQWVDHFVDHLPDASLVAALARRESVLDAVPDAQRTFMKFADGSYSGCNLFFLRDDSALGVIDFWQRVEEHRKNPARLFGILGAKAVTSYMLGRLTLADALDHLSARVETRCAVVEMPFGESAVDVDKPEDIELARRIMAGRAAG